MTKRLWLRLGALVILIGASWLLRDEFRLWLLRPTAAAIAYGPASPAQRLDIYVPAAAARPYPAVIFIHGGAFFFGSRRDPLPSFIAGVKRLNAAGIALVSIDYRMTGEARFPAALRDARSAVRWLRANGARYDIDPARIGVWGESAGGNLALLVGVTDRATQFDDPAIAPGVSSHVSAVVAQFPVVDFLQMDRQFRAGTCGAAAATHDAVDSPESRYVGAPVQTVPARVAASNPVRYVRGDAPPMLLQAGTADCTVPYAQSVLMAGALAAAHVPHRLMLLPGADHADAAFATAANQAIIVDFFRQALSRPPVPRRAASPSPRSR